MPYNPYREPRKSPRLKNYDYAQSGYYFVTLITHQREHLFGEIVDGEVRLSDAGTIARASWTDLPVHYPYVVLDAYVVMPNHVHGILELKASAENGYGLPEIVRGFKTYSARRVNLMRETAGFPVWQRSFHDRIIRNDAELNAIRQYILNNPAKWAEDGENVQG